MVARTNHHIRHEDDFYATPEWVTRIALPHVFSEQVATDVQCVRVLDPCCGDGKILSAVKQWGTMIGLDCTTVGYELDETRAKEAEDSGVVVLKTGDALKQEWVEADVLITNPPYKLAENFVIKALEAGYPTVAMLLRLNWLASMKRRSFHTQYPSDVHVLPKRPSFTANGRTDSTEYAWFVWGKGRGNRWFIL
jgi:predicted RNA methylase